MTKKNLILTSTAAGIAGFGLSSIYHAEKESSPFDDRSKAIYESMIECYKRNISPKIPPEWQVEKLERGQIKSKKMVKDMDALRELLRILQYAQTDLEKNITSPIRFNKLHYLLN